MELTDIAHGGDLNPLQTAEISTEIYVLLNEEPRIGYPAKTIVKILNARYNSNLKLKSVKHRLDVLHQRGRCFKTERRNPDHHNNITVYHAVRGPFILLESPAYRIAQALLEIQERNEY